MAAPAIEVEGLSKRYPNGIEAVQDFSLRVERGEIIGLLGPNGSGKTTTINLLTTTFRPSRGGGQILGFDLIRKVDRIRRRISLVPQYETIDWSLSVAQNLEVFANLLGLSRAAQRIAELLELVQLQDRRDTLIEELSGGQIRRLQIARAFLFPADILFMDELTVGLDPVGVEQVLGYVKQRAREGQTIVLASNIMEEVQSICDRIVFLHRGRLMYQGPHRDLVARVRLAERVTVHSRETPPAALVAELERAGLEVACDDPLEVTGVDAGRAVVSALTPFIARGFAIDSLIVREPTLRDAFLQITRAGPEELSA